MSQNTIYLNPPGLAPAQGLYSHVGVIKGGVTHMIAGQLAVADNGEVDGVGDFTAQFARVFSNLAATLKAVGGDCTSIVKMNTYLVDENDIPAFMKLRAELFPTLFPEGVYPPNTLLIVKRLVKKEFLLEVEASAAI